jgi:adenylate cyclase
MAELEARWTKDGSRTWRRPLPPTPVRIGREGPDVWGAEWDPQISKLHATVHWQNGRLLVQRRVVPTKTTNPIYYKGNETDQFSIGPGEHFIIGDTTFTLLDEESMASSPPPLRPTELTIGRDDLLQRRFADPGRRIDALATLPDLIRHAPDDTELQDRVLEVLLMGIPHATAAAVVSVEEAGGGEPRVAVRGVRQRPVPGRSGEFRPARRLVLNAVRRERATVGHVFNRDLGPEDSRYVTLSDDKTEWAICSPLPDEPTPGWGLYVAGQLPRPILSSESAANDPEVAGDIKFTFLTAEFFGSLRQILDLRQRAAQLRRFFSPAVLKALSARDTDAVVTEREATVTVLFCDLRGS